MSGDGTTYREKRPDPRCQCDGQRGRSDGDMTSDLCVSVKRCWVHFQGTSLTQSSSHVDASETITPVTSANQQVMFYSASVCVSVCQRFTRKLLVASSWNCFHFGQGKTE